MASEQPSENADTNLLWAVTILTVAAGVSALGSAWICESVLAAFGSSQTMALIIVDGGRELKSDDANLERQLTTATLALQTVRDFGWCLGMGCLGVLGAVAWRVWARGRKSESD
jgi:hypothetical protein